MPRLTFPITQDGLSVDVRVNLDTASMAFLHGAGQPVPLSVPGKGLIDTGTDITVVSPLIIQQLGIPVHDYRKTTGIGGQVYVRLFQVTLFILNESQPQLPWFTVSDLLVMEMPSALPVDVLIGMDVIRISQLLVDGPGQQFVLDF